MTTKLVSMNLGVRLTLEVDGKIQDVEWSAVCPTQSIVQPDDALSGLCNLINKYFDTDLFIDGGNWKIQIARPKRIKAPPHMSQDEYNRRIQELGK